MRQKISHFHPTNLAVERLKNSPIREGLEELKSQKELLSEQNLEKAKQNKMPDLTIEEVKKGSKFSQKQRFKRPLRIRQ